MRIVTGLIAGCALTVMACAVLRPGAAQGNDTGLPLSRERQALPDRRESSRAPRTSPSGFPAKRATASAEPGPGVVPQVDTTITIRASGSSLEFQPARIAVKTGLNVRLRFVNDGTLPHNVALPRSDDDLDAIAVAAYQAGETGYIPPAHKDQLIAYTTLASPGQTVEATFVVPPPGEYTYVCLFPGHANSMLGTLRALK